MGLQQSLRRFASPHGAPGRPGLTCVEERGHAWTGESAALVRFARSYAEANRGVLVIPHFVGASPGSTSRRSPQRSSRVPSPCLAEG
jgi:hypothetical protein